MTSIRWIQAPIQMKPQQQHSSIADEKIDIKVFSFIFKALLAYVFTQIKQQIQYKYHIIPSIYLNLCPFYVITLNYSNLYSN